LWREAWFEIDHPARRNRDSAPVEHPINWFRDSHLGFGAGNAPEIQFSICIHPKGKEMVIKLFGRQA
jgi:hypothetical protein